MLTIEGRWRVAIGRARRHYETRCGATDLVTGGCCSSAITQGVAAAPYAILIVGRRPILYQIAWRFDEMAVVAQARVDAVAFPILRVDAAYGWVDVDARIHLGAMGVKATRGEHHDYKTNEPHRRSTRPGVPSTMPVTCGGDG